MTRKEVVKDLRKVLRNLQDESLFDDDDFRPIKGASRVYQYLISHIMKY